MWPLGGCSSRQSGRRRGQSFSSRGRGAGWGAARTRDAVSDEVPDDATEAGVKDGLEQDVLDVLGADRTGGEHREARLHEKHQDSTLQ